jgi:RNA 2',3'-cyclic 3'-phosphodiesterase
MASVETRRLFVAVFPPPEVAQQLAEAARAVAQTLSPTAVAWTQPVQIHLTLNFLGSVEQGRLPEIQRAVEQACQRGEPHFLQARGLGCFPGLARPRILWSGLDGAVPVLEGLKRRLDESLARLGCPSDERPFHPHLTIGRVKKLAGNDQRRLAATLPQWRRTEFGLWTVERIELMQSVLLPSGAEYARVQSFPLAARK